MQNLQGSEPATIADMPARLTRSAELYAGAPTPYAAVAPPGGLIFTAGACPIDATGEVTAQCAAAVPKARPWVTRP
jgi:hypothetical protein